MFEAGKVYKVKVELADGQAGFGRATVVERKGNQLTILVRTSKGLDASLPKGTKIWFVSDSTESFSGLWGSSIIEIKTAAGQRSMVCSPPKLEPLYQRRRTPRVAIDVPVQVYISDNQTLFDVRSRDISRSGIAIESAPVLSESVGAGDIIKLIIHSSIGAIPLSARIIRVEKNWLANKTIVGLEFTEISDESVATLDKLLIQHGGKPRNADAEAPKQETGLASWMSAPTETKGHFVGTALDGAPVEFDSEDESVSETVTDEGAASRADAISAQSKSHEPGSDDAANTESPNRANSASKKMAKQSKKECKDLRLTKALRMV